MSIQPKRVRRKRRRQVSWLQNLQLRSGLVISIFVVLGFGVGLFAFSSVRKGWTRWHKASLLTKAADRLEHNQLAEAETMARKALAIDANSLTAARILAESTEKQNRAETVAWRAQIARLAPSLDNQLNLASAALRFGQLDAARDALARVAPEEHDKAPFHVVAGWLSRAQGNIADEERHFAAAVAQEPKNDVYQFNLAVLQIRSPDPGKNTAARSQLERLSKVAQFRTESLRALLDHALRQNQNDAANELAQALQMSPEVTFSDYLLCLDLYRKLSPKKFDALLDKVKPVAARDSRDLAQLLSWMNKNDLADSALKWSDKLPADLTSKPPAATSVAESLARTKNWSRLKRWTRSGTWGNDEYLRLAYQAYAARRSRRTVGEAQAEFEALWNSAEEAAQEHPEREVTLARLASAWALTREAEQLWLRVAKVPAARREALDALYALYRQANDLPNLHLTAQRLHESSPEEIALAANAARFALLLDRNTADGRALAQQVYEKSPNDAGAAITYAFALYGTGRTAEAVEILKKLPPGQLDDPHAAVYAALLFDDAGQPELANKHIALAKGGAIFPEEKQLLEEITNRRQNAGAAPNEPSPTPSPSRKN